jgi:sucrose-6-phosphate hydrolase SacC (GH32 family)
MLDYQINMNPKSQITLSFGDKYVVSVNPSQAKLSVNGPGIDVGRPCPVDTSKPVKIQVFVDETMIEIFINDQYAQTCPIDKWWPMEPTLKISKQYGEVDVRKLQVRVPE